MGWQVCSVALICNQQRKCLLMRHKSTQPDCESANRDVRKLFNRKSSTEFQNMESFDCSNTKEKVDH